MNSEDATVTKAVEGCLEDIASVIDSVADRVRKNGRVIYIGAGTSGRYFATAMTLSVTLTSFLDLVY